MADDRRAPPRSVRLSSGARDPKLDEMRRRRRKALHVKRCDVRMTGVLQRDGQTLQTGLTPASGTESYQFREIEIVCGLRDDPVEQRHQDGVLAGEVEVEGGPRDPRAPREVGLRALAQLLMTVSGQPYRPRFERLERLYDRLATGQLGGGCTLHGCRITVVPKQGGAFGPGTVLIAPEPGRDKKSKPKRKP